MHRCDNHQIKNPGAYFGLYLKLTSSAIWLVFSWKVTIIINVHNTSVSYDRAWPEAMLSLGMSKTSHRRKQSLFKRRLIIANAFSTIAKALPTACDIIIGPRPWKGEDKVSIDRLLAANNCTPTIKDDKGGSSDGSQCDLPLSSMLLLSFFMPIDLPRENQPYCAGDTSQNRHLGCYLVIMTSTHGWIEEHSST